MRDIKLSGIAVMLALGACNAVTNGPDADIGASVRHNMAVQIINPEPVYEEPAPVLANRPALAIERYRTDTITPLPSTRTSDVGGDSGGGGGPN